MRVGHACLFGLVAALVAVSALVACATSQASSSDVVDAQSMIPSVDAAQEDAGAWDADASAPSVDCLELDFCSVPIPVSNLVSLNSIWGSSASDLWIVGTRGTILHGNGTNFEDVSSGTSDVLFAVWGTAADDVWVLRGASPMHSAGIQTDGGVSWELVRGSSYNPNAPVAGRFWAGWSHTRDDVWIVGDINFQYGDIGSFWSKGEDADGGVQWTKALACDKDDCTSVPYIHGAWGAERDRAWAVGTAGDTFELVVPEDGGDRFWLRHDARTTYGLEGVWGSGKDDVWSVGESGTIRHFTRGKDDYWAIASSPTTKNLHAIWGSASSNIWAVGDDGTILHYDGVAWQKATMAFPPGGPPPHLYGIWGSGASEDVWIVGEGVVLHRTSKNRRSR